MKSFLVAAAMLVGGLAWAAPADLSTQQIRCFSADAAVGAVVVTLPGGEAFVYGQDFNSNKTFDEDEIFLFEGARNVTASSQDFNQYISGFQGTAAFGTVQEISVDVGDAVVTFYYGFSVDAYQDVDFALLTSKPKDGSQISLLPLSCEAFEPPQN